MIPAPLVFLDGHQFAVTVPWKIELQLSAAAGNWVDPNQFCFPVKASSRIDSKSFPRDDFYLPIFCPLPYNLFHVSGSL